MCNFDSPKVVELLWGYQTIHVNEPPLGVPEYFASSPMTLVRDHTLRIDYIWLMNIYPDFYDTEERDPAPHCTVLPERLTTSEQQCVLN